MVDDFITQNMPKASSDLPNDLVKMFHQILEQYKMSPFGFRMRKTGYLLKVVEHNGLLYLDSDNLYKIVCELFECTVPENLREYIQRIVFMETVTLDDRKYQNQVQVTCTQFVDREFFGKCQEWLAAQNGRNSNSLDFDYSFMKSLDRVIDPLGDLYENLGNISKIDEMMPFKELWKFTESDPDSKTPGCTASERGNYIVGRPRGKQMNLTPDSLKQRPYVCEAPFCDRAFKRHEHLKRHMRMHTGDRPFKCEFPGCNRGFSRSDNLAQHMKLHDISFKKSKSICFGNSKKSTTESIE